MLGFDEAIGRANAALEAGADMAFVEAPQTMEEVAAVPRLVKGPCLLNVVWRGKTPDIAFADAQKRMGYKLAIVPGMLFKAVIGVCERLLAELKSQRRHPAHRHRDDGAGRVPSRRRRRMGRGERALSRRRARLEAIPGRRIANGAERWPDRRHCSTRSGRRMRSRRARMAQRCCTSIATSSMTGRAMRFACSRQQSLPVRRPDRTFATPDHYVATSGRGLSAINEPNRRSMVEDLEVHARKTGVTLFGLNDRRQGIVHVVGPEQGLSQPGMIIVCGDSHTATHGAVGALAFGVGASEVTHVLATQTLWQSKPRNMRVTVDGTLAPGVHAKDVILAIIAKIGAAGGTGHVIEYAGSTIRGLSIEGRLDGVQHVDRGRRPRRHGRT